MGEEDQSVTTHEMAELAVMRSKAYAFLSSIYNQLPDRNLAGWLKDEGAAALGALNSEGQDDLTAGLKLVKEYLRASADTAPDQIVNDLAVERTRLLRGIKPGYGPPPPYESVYRGTDATSMGQTGQEVLKCYAEAGVGLPADLRERPDYIGLELDFMRYLAGKEAQAWQEEKEDEALGWLEQERHFLVEHVVSWIPRFCNLMEQEAALDFYRGVARITKAFVLTEQERVAALMG